MEGIGSPHPSVIQILTFLSYVPDSPLMKLPPDAYRTRSQLSNEYLTTCILLREFLKGCSSS